MKFERRFLDSSRAWYGQQLVQGREAKGKYFIITSEKEVTNLQISIVLGVKRENMSTELKAIAEKARKVEVKVHNSSPDTVYAIGAIGAWIYYFSRATTTQERLKAFLKGIVWPAILVKEMLAFFHQE